MASSLAHASELAALLAATDIDRLELTGPDGHLVLVREGRAVVEAPPEAAETALTVVSPAMGVFLHTHPLHEEPLAPAGTPVAAGQAVGLLRIGAVLLPVTVPRAGTLSALLKEDGALTGYGDPVAELIPHEE